MLGILIDKGWLQALRLPAQPSEGIQANRFSDLSTKSIYGRHLVALNHMQTHVVPLHGKGQTQKGVARSSLSVLCFDRVQWSIDY